MRTMKNIVQLILLLGILSMSKSISAQVRVFILFDYHYPESYYASFSPKKADEIGSFVLQKKVGDCAENSFGFFKARSPLSVLTINIDSLTNIVTSKWVANQCDTTLVNFFKNKHVYIIPKDSLKCKRGKAYLVSYTYCEKI